MAIMVFKKGLEKGLESVKSQGILIWIMSGNPEPEVVYIKKFKPDFLRNYCAILNQILYESFQVQGNENLLT